MRPDGCVFRSRPGAAPLKLEQVGGLLANVEVFRSRPGAAPLKPTACKLGFPWIVFRSRPGAAPLKRLCTSCSKWGSSAPDRERPH